MKENSIIREFANQDEEPLISVIVPIYNVEKYLHKCIDSIINQTYKNLQILLINDGSTDSCGRICDDFAKKDPRIRVFHKINEGQCSARNLGLDFAEGKYVNFIDSDDWIDANFYSKLLKHAENNRLDICVSSRKSFTNSGLESILSVGDSNNTFYSIDHYFAHYFFKPFTPSSCNKLYLHNYIIDNCIRFQPVNYVGSEDTLFNFSFLMYANVIGSVDDTYYNQFIREGSTALTYKDGIMLRTKNLITECYKLIRKENKNDASHRAAIAYMFLYFVNNNISKIKVNPKKELEEEFKLIHKERIVREFSKEIVKNKKLNGILRHKGYRFKGILITKLIHLSIYLNFPKITIKLLRAIFKLN